MMWHYKVVFLFVILMSIVGQICDAKRSEVISLTSENWKDTLEGEWMIKFYAPWCPACKAIEADYKAFADWGDDLNVRAGEVNIDEEPGLSGRFIVTALPSIYHAKNGEFRRYTGERHSNALHKYVEEKFWRATEPVAWYRHPDSIPMSLMSSLFQSSILIKGFYESLTETYGFSTAMAYVIFGLVTVATGLILGLILVFIIDCVSPPKPHRPQPTVVQDADIEKESAEEEDDADRESTGRESVSGSEQGDGDNKRASKDESSGDGDNKRASKDESSEDEENEGQQSQRSSQSSSQTSQEWENVQVAETEEAEKTFEAEKEIPAFEKDHGEIRKRNVQKTEDDEKPEDDEK